MPRLIRLLLASIVLLLDAGQSFAVEISEVAPQSKDDAGPVPTRRQEATWAAATATHHPADATAGAAAPSRWL